MGKVNSRIDNAAGVVRKNRAAQAKATRRLNRMADSFNQQLSAIRKTLARDRKHAENRLRTATSKVWAAFNAQREAQRRKNAAMEAATRRMRLDAFRNIRLAKAAFRKKIHSL